MGECKLEALVHGIKHLTAPGCLGGTKSGWQRETVVALMIFLVYVCECETEQFRILCVFSWLFLKKWWQTRKSEEIIRYWGSKNARCSFRCWRIAIFNFPPTDGLTDRDRDHEHGWEKNGLYTIRQEQIKSNPGQRGWPLRLADRFSDPVLCLGERCSELILINLIKANDLFSLSHAGLQLNLTLGGGQ